MKTKNTTSKHLAKERRKEDQLRKLEAEKAIDNALKKHNKVKKVLFPKMVESIYENWDQFFCAYWRYSLL